MHSYYQQKFPYDSIYQGAITPIINPLEYDGKFHPTNEPFVIVRWSTSGVRFLYFTEISPIQKTDPEYRFNMPSASQRAYVFHSEDSEFIPSAPQNNRSYDLYVAVNNQEIATNTPNRIQRYYNQELP